MICHKNTVAKHGGGVAFLIKSIINYTIIEQLMVDVENVFECLTVRLIIIIIMVIFKCYFSGSS